jgi:isocitrate dehydrogenase kinase/phosphatase
VRLHPSASRLANKGAEAIEQALDGYLSGFREVTRRAGHRFARRDWRGGLSDATRRLDLYGASVAEVLERVRRLLGDRVEDRLVWAGMKAVYSSRVGGRADWKLAETFFNSVTRRVFATVGVDPDVEFVDTDALEPPAAALRPVHRTYPGGEPAGLVHRILEDRGLAASFPDLEADVRLAAERLQAAAPGGIEEAEVVEAVFYRRKGAYLVGRLRSGGRWVPLVLALVNRGRGMVVDAVLTAEDDVSILFSFTRSHFQVDAEPAHTLVEFLRTLMPRKRVAELYISIGHHKHGKTELYRDLIHHLRASEERFDLAPGAPGLVMVTYAMDGYDLVVKVIRDRFPARKRTTQGRVREKYRLVFRHDRAGRLVEAHEFEHLRLDRRRFADRLLEELLGEAGRTVRVEGDYVVIDHAYIERRVTPLDVHLAQAGPQAAREAVVDYGRAIEDLAATGVFPGDLLIKNFGVTRHGRVVSYDYDELELLSAVRVRELPPPRTLEEELAPEPWFGVGPADVFPEEFPSFLGLEGNLREVFETHHAHLFEPEFWRGMQKRLAAGEIVDILPYREELRLRRPVAASGSAQPCRPGRGELIDLSIGGGSETWLIN